LIIFKNQLYQPKKTGK